jgi:hypothetical protein
MNKKGVSLSDIIMTAKKSRRVRWAEHVAHIKNDNSCEVLVGTAELSDYLGD